MSAAAAIAGSSARPPTTSTPTASCDFFEDSGGVKGSGGENEARRELRPSVWAQWRQQSPLLMEVGFNFGGVPYCIRILFSLYQDPSTISGRVLVSCISH